jgi:hypothetical protein
VRLVADNATTLDQLGLLSELAGHWKGRGFNLIARPDHDGGGPLFLELNQTTETLDITPIGSPVPNRGFAQGDITLFGLTYLQKVSDSVTGGALHIEPGIWVTQPATTNPAVTAPAGGQIAARMANIPHGTSLLAQGGAIPVAELQNGTFAIPKANTAPFAAGGPMPLPGTQGGFPAYDLSNASGNSFRTPFGNVPEIPLPATIGGVPLQTLINDPVALLQADIKGQNISKMVVINISTVATIPQVGGSNLSFPDGAGGTSQLQFLTGINGTGVNANAATVFATFWLETIQGQGQQLQYAQTVLLNFPDSTTGKMLSWPHVSVATMHKTFG